MDFSDAMAEFYLGGVDNFDSDHIEEIVDMLGDSAFIYPTHKFADELSYVLPGSVNQYIFAYNGENHQFDLDGFDGKQYGANHGDDLFYYWWPFYG